MKLEQLLVSLDDRIEGLEEDFFSTFYELAALKIVLNRFIFLSFTKIIASSGLVDLCADAGFGMLISWPASSDDVE